MTVTSTSRWHPGRDWHTAPAQAPGRGSCAADFSARGCPHCTELCMPRALVSFAPTSTAVMRRSSERCSSPLVLSVPVKTFALPLRVPTGLPNHDRLSTGFPGAHLRGRHPAPPGVNNFNLEQADPQDLQVTGGGEEGFRCLTVPLARRPEPRRAT